MTWQPQEPEWRPDPSADLELLELDLIERLHAAEALPLGEERIEMIVQVSNWAAKFDLAKVEFLARLELTWNALADGNTSQALASFSWCLGYFWDSEARLPAEYTQALMQQFLALPQMAARHPDVPIDTVNLLLEWMDYFTSHSGISTSSRWSVHHQVDLALGQREGAWDALKISQTAAEQQLGPLSSNLDESTSPEACPLHKNRAQIAWESSEGNYVAAMDLIDEAAEVTKITGVSCNNPDDMASLLMLPMAWSGRGDEAWRNHVVGYRHQVDSHQYLGDIATHLRYCAATWAIPEGFEIIEAHAEWFANPEDPWDLLTSARAVAIFLERAREASLSIGEKEPVLPFRIPGTNPWHPFQTLEGLSLSEVSATLKTVCLELAHRYDRRNGNDTISRRTERIFREPSVCNAVEVKELLVSRSLRKQALTTFSLHQHIPAWVLPFSPLDAELGKATHTDTPPPSMPGNQARSLLEDSQAVLLSSSALYGISLTNEHASWWAAKAAIEAADQQWEAAQEACLKAIDMYLSLTDARHMLGPLCYLIQVQWQLGNLEGARESMVQADGLVDASTLPQIALLLEELTPLAG